MSQEKMKMVHQLIEDRNYLEARGILESEPDIDPRSAEKWLTWLEEVQREERRLAGVGVDKKKQNPDRAFDQVLHISLGAVFMLVASVPTWLVIKQIMTYETSSIPTSGFFMLFALILGLYGWLKLGELISATRPVMIGGGVVTGLMLALIVSGMPFWYYYEPPLIFLLAAFALVFPGITLIGGQLSRALVWVWRQFNRTTD